MPKSSESTPRLTSVLVTHEASGVDDTGIVGPYLESLGHRVVRHQVFSTIETKEPDVGFPSVEGVDLVVVFGSTAHAWDEEHAPWVEQEVEWVRQVIDRGISLVGICFGGQLLATALGGSVCPVRDHEVGMLTFPTEQGCPVAGGPWFSWHSDVVTLPDSARVWSASEVGPQVFTQGRTLGLQFHPEVSVELADAWIDAWLDALPTRVPAQKFRDEVHRLAPASQAACRSAIDWTLEVLPLIAHAR